MSMEMDHSFTVPVPPEQAWDVLLDVERIADRKSTRLNSSH